ncbi:hypothetical protein Pan189_02710 [Stratiformator vulcanicus]|uniref:Uncharacterized protein n=1 Tax=Stratiformator vulcanicus TaxID=2527980 RepID=A0A517QWH5_9PLAN|nr:hypothetical protein Pan189_02710 [Stratiformator vulcanicus]
MLTEIDRPVGDVSAAASAGGARVSITTVLPLIGRTTRPTNMTPRLRQLLLRNQFLGLLYDIRRFTCRVETIALGCLTQVQKFVSGAEHLKKV